MAELTIAFVDLTGSVSVFETLGNDRAAKAVTKLTQWIGSMGLEHNGKVVKMLGDGVLLSFTNNRLAVECMSTIQQEHSQRVAQWPNRLKLMMQIGMARGQVVQVDGDCFGDAVNVASRLSDLAGPEQILANDTVIRKLGKGHSVRSRSLGPMRIKGRVEPAKCSASNGRPRCSRSSSRCRPTCTPCARAPNRCSVASNWAGWTPASPSTSPTCR
jgi:adenylate cyclase